MISTLNFLVCAQNKLSDIKVLKVDTVTTSFQVVLDDYFVQGCFMEVVG